MLRSQVNRSCSLLALAFAFACNSARSSNTAGESTGAVRPETAKVASASPVNDSILTRADLARIQGSASAPVWVIVVSDFQCPYCKQWHDQTYATFRDEFVKTGKVRMAYVNFPLSSHPFAWPSAESAMCAGEQGKFWQMHDALFTTQSEWETKPSPAPIFDSLAKATGVDLPRWRECVKSGKMRPLIQADHDRAQRAGASATPSFMIGNQLLVGAQPIDNLRRAIDSALVHTKKTSP
ncbi:MAG: DsbA family protein [Gemmatimonadaceae bacterium]